VLAEAQVLEARVELMLTIDVFNRLALGAAAEEDGGTEHGQQHRFRFHDGSFLNVIGVGLSKRLEHSQDAHARNRFRAVTETANRR
jgi:hypothetical protein